MDLQIERVLEVLKKTAFTFWKLDGEATTALIEKNPEKYEMKLKEKAQLLINLPDRLTQPLEGVKEELRQKITWQVTTFAAIAKEALNTNNIFGLGVLLTHMGRKSGEKNDLEKLIEFIEKEVSPVS